MNRFTKIVLLFAASCLLLAGAFSAHAGRLVEYDLRDYYPLNQGDVWTFFVVDVDRMLGVVEREAGTESETASGEEDVNGVSTIKLGEWEGQEYEYRNVAWNENGLWLHRTVESDDGNISEERFVEPLLLLPAEMNVGDVYEATASSNVYENGEQVGYTTVDITITLVDLEDVAVEAGAFADCLKFHVEMTQTLYEEQGQAASATLVQDAYWHLALDTGLVKSETTATATENIGGPRLTSTSVETVELRWSTVNGANIGDGPRLFAGIATHLAGATFNESTMTINNFISGDQVYNGLVFRLDLVSGAPFYSFQPGGSGPVAIPDLDFGGAYIKMNGAALNIYNIDYNGNAYRIDWTLGVDPAVGFSLVGVEPM